MQKTDEPDPLLDQAGDCSNLYDDGQAKPRRQCQEDCPCWIFGWSSNCGFVNPINLSL